MRLALPFAALLGLSLVTSSAAAQAPVAPAAPAAPAVGDVAPAFTAPAADAQGPTAAPVSLAALRGKVVVLAFYPADRTGGCTAELTKFRDEFRTLFGPTAGGDVVVLPISGDDLASHASWAKEMRFPFALVSDPQLAVAERYGARGAGASHANRVLYVIDREGRVAYRDLRFNALGEGAYRSMADAVAKARGS
jgi:peroxiredoxin Q/BCP